MKRILFLVVLAAFWGGCGDSLECRDGVRECDKNVSRTCVLGEWRKVVCKGNAPICDVKYGCRKQDMEAKCGNGIIESGEACDGEAEHGGKCSDMNAALSGVPVCGADCQLDYKGCGLSQCLPGDKQCNGDSLEYCSDGVWEDGIDCSESGMICDSENKKCRLDSEP